MYFLLLIFLFLIVVVFLSVKPKKKRKNSKRHKCVFYALSRSDRECVKKLKEQILTRINNLPNIYKFKSFKTLSNLGLEKKPVYKVDICSYKQFYLFNAVKREIKEPFNLVLLFKKKIPLFHNKGVYCFKRKNLSLDEFTCLNAFDVSHSNTKMSNYVKLINFEKEEIDHYYSNNFLISEYNGITIKYSRDELRRYYKFETVRCEKVVIGLSSIVGGGVAFVKKIKGGFIIKSPYSNSVYYLLTNAKSLLKSSFTDNLILYGKNFEVCISEKLEDLKLVKQQIVDSLKNNRLFIKSGNKEFDRIFNYSFVNIIIRNLIVYDNVEDYKNYLTCSKREAFDFKKLKKIYLLDSPSRFYNYLKSEIVGFSERNGRIKINPKSGFLTNYELTFNNFKIVVSNQQREVTKIDVEDVSIINPHVIPKGEFNKIKVFC